MNHDETRYSIGDLSQKYYVTEKTIRNYIERMAEVFEFNKESLKIMNEKGTLEYSLTSEQEKLMGILIQGIEEDPYLKKKRDIEKIQERELREHRDKLIERIEKSEEKDLKERIMDSEIYKMGQQLKSIYTEKEMMQDAFFFLIEQIPLEERINMESRLLETDKKVVNYLLKRFIEDVGKQAYDSLILYSKKEADELIEPSEEQLKEKIKDLLDERFKNNSLLGFHYAGYSIIEKSVGELIKDTLTMKEKNEF